MIIRVTGNDGSRCRKNHEKGECDYFLDDTETTAKHGV
jgi:hypothetical protein